MTASFTPVESVPADRREAAPLGQAGVPASASRWASPKRAAVAQRRRLMRFLLESAFFDARSLQHQWGDIYGGQANPIQDAQQVGYRGRPWLTPQQVQAQHHWRWPKPPTPEKPPRPPAPGLTLTAIARVLGISRERVRRHAQRPGFPPPMPLTLVKNRYRAADIEAYYRECADAWGAYGRMRPVRMPRRTVRGRPPTRWRQTWPTEAGEVRLDLPIDLDAAAWGAILVDVVYSGILSGPKTTIPTDLVGNDEDQA